MIDSVKRLSLEDQSANFNYRVGGLFGLSLSGVPTKKTRGLDFPKSWVLNQTEFEGDNDECAGVSGSRVMSILNGYACAPHFLWMMARQRAGAKKEDFGLSNRDLAMAMVKVGALRLEDEPFTFKNGRDFIQEPANWDLINLRPKALEQICGSVVWVTPSNGMDAFDVFRSSIMKLNKQYGKPHAAVFGLLWNYDFSAKKLDTVATSGTGHDTVVLDEWDGDYATMLNSLGLDAGENGEHQVHRSIINKWAEEFGMFIPIDATQEEINNAIAIGGRLDRHWTINILISLYRFLLDMPKAIARGLKKDVGCVDHAKMLWDTPEHIRRNVRVMCDEAGLSLATKNVICAIIKQESNWNPKAYNNKNFNGTADHGLLQINDHKGYHIGEGLYFASVDEVYNDPEKSVRFVIQMAKVGRLNLWSSYKFGHYKKHLLSEARSSKPY